MLLLGGGRPGAGEAARIGAASALASDRLAALSDEDRRAVNAVAPEDLRDFDAVLQAARYLLVKYEDRRELRALLRTLVGVIERSAEGLGGIDDEMGELVLSAEDSIRRIREAHASVGSVLLGGVQGAAAPPGGPCAAGAGPGPSPVPPSFGPAPGAPAPDPAPATAPATAADRAPSAPAARPAGVDNLTTDSTGSDTAHYQQGRPCQTGAVV